MLPQPGVNVLCRRRAPLVGGPHPPFARDDGGDGGLIGEQDAGPVCQGDFGLVAADLLNFHWSGVVWYGIILQGQRRSWSAASASASAVT